MENFTRVEFENRVERARRLMIAAGIDALLMTTEANFYYFSGFHSQTWVSPTRPRYLILPQSGEPVAVVPTSNVPGMRATSWIKEVRSWNAPRPEDDGISLVIDALRSASGKVGAIGAEIGAESRLGMPVLDFLSIGRAVGDRRIVDAGPVLRPLRMIKSAAEIERIRHVASIVSEGFAALPMSMRAGDTEREVYRCLQADLIRRGAEKTPYVVCVSGSGGYENTNMGPSDRVLELGDIMFIDTGSTFGGYFCDFDRHFAIGPVDAATQRAYELVYRATDAGINAVKPGCRTCDIWSAMTEVLAESGATLTGIGRMGHGIGLLLTEPPSITSTDETELVPGMVITVEPGIGYRPDGGDRLKLMVHEENLVVTENGAQLLSRRASPEIAVVR